MAPTSAPLIPAAQPPGESGPGAPTQRNSFPSFQLGTQGSVTAHRNRISALGSGLRKVSWSTWFSDPCFKGNLPQNPNIQSKHQGSSRPPLQCVKLLRISVCPSGGKTGLLIATDLLNSTRQVNSWQSWEGPSTGCPRASKKQQGPGGSRGENRLVQELHSWGSTTLRVFCRGN